MDIYAESVNKVLRTLFPKPKYNIYPYIGEEGFSYSVHNDHEEIFSFSFYKNPEIFFTKPVKYKDEFNTLNEIFYMHQVGLYRFEVKGFKDDSE